MPRTVEARNFLFAHFDHGIADSLAADAGSLDSAERHGIKTIVGALVDQDGPHLEPLDRVERRLQSAREYGGLQTQVGGIGARDRFFETIEGREQRDWTIDFVAHEDVAVRNVFYQRRLHDCPLARAAYNDAATQLNCRTNRQFDACSFLLVDDATHIG